MVERATGELETALAAQNCAFAERFEQRWFPPGAQRVARMAASVVCALVAAPSIFLVVSTPSRCSSSAYDKISARWMRDGEPDKSWQRDLGAFAYVGADLCAISPKPRSFYPTVLVLLSDRAALGPELEAHGVEIGDLPEEVPLDYGLAPA